MNAVFQFLLANSWILIPIIIGLFNVGVRVQQKAKEQQARRAAQTEIARRRQEALRTGRSVDEPVIVYDEQDREQDDRKARIEALRKQRMQQLQALREKRAAVQSSTGAPRPRPAAPLPPKARPAQQSHARFQHPALPKILSQQQRRPQPPSQFQSQPSSRRAQPQSQSQARTRPQPSPQAPTGGISPQPASGSQIGVQPPKRPQIAATDLRSSTRAKRARKRQQSETLAVPAVDTSVSPGRIGRHPASAESPRSMLTSRAKVRQAIALREILGPPTALRDPRQGPGSFSI